LALGIVHIAIKLPFLVLSVFYNLLINGFIMYNNDNNETESPAIIEEIIPGKNTDHNDKSLNQDNSNNRQSYIQKYEEQEAAKEVIGATEEPRKAIERNTGEYASKIPGYSQVILDTQEQTVQATREITEFYLELQKQTLNSFQKVFQPYFQNIQRQLLSNQEYFYSMSALHYKLISDYTESVIVSSKIFNKVSSSNMNFLMGLIKPIPVNQSRMGNSKVDSGKNSDENSTNIKATFSCETCGQTFESRQDLKEHTSIKHYNTQ
jgi:hypothetical protein